MLKNFEEQNSNQSICNWLQKITQMQNDIQRKLNLEKVPDSSNPIHSFTEFPVKGTSTNVQPQPQANRVVKYQDLPYMGEMTLDNSKPRRGRKPKKADICHLIYKNYGTIFPGTPNSKNPLDKEYLNAKKNESKNCESPQPPETVNRTDVQNRIISSLLEKRLTQESKLKKDNLTSKNNKTSTRTNQERQNEPLNLCIRDLNQLKIRLLKKHDSVYSTDSAELKSEPTSDDEIELVHESSSSASSNKEFKFPNITPEIAQALSNEASKANENGVAPGGYVYWPNAGVFIHPMALQQQLMYYQKLAANNNYTLPNYSTSESPEIATTPELQSSEFRKIVPKIKLKKVDATGESEQHNHEGKMKRNVSISDKTPTKRKRSAIFIPPIPAENQTNPATEVSICKFKFTGGAKPSLQEKKMLSVDSGGNFRYYSGTGDKSMRGYEFFPRETLQQQAGSQGSSTGAFLQASGEKIPPSAMLEFTGKQDFMLTPELQQPALAAITDIGPRHKKRKTKKSLQREKLEQTFKEKGFLIQTQQLESAEGATYCKFRQLRKFTRYLFRSWKDYLPGNVAEAPEGERSESDDISEQDIDNLKLLKQNDLS